MHELTRTQLQQQLLAHWQMLKPAASPADVAGCARCAEPSAPSCRFHPDARAFAFGSGRFDFAFSSLWDTPHDHFFCCNTSSSSAPGCLEEVCAACISSQDRCCFGVDDTEDPGTVTLNPKPCSTHLFADTTGRSSTLQTPFGGLLTSTWPRRYPTMMTPHKAPATATCELCLLLLVPSPSPFPR